MEGRERALKEREREALVESEENEVVEGGKGVMEKWVGERESAFEEKKR